MLRVWVLGVCVEDVSGEGWSVEGGRVEGVGAECVLIQDLARTVK